MAETENQAERNWGAINEDALSMIFMHVGSIYLIKHAQFVNKHWRNVSFNPSIWKVADFTTLEGDMVAADSEKMLREVVDRSKGQIEELWIGYFSPVDILSYVADRTSILKRLHLISAYNINDEGLMYMLKKQPQLEELEITFGAFSDGIFKEIGKACPNLCCFRFNQKRKISETFQCDEYAKDIANNMPELRVLQLFGNPLTDNGLGEILDKCKHLESLDIRCSFAVDVNAEIEAKAKGLREFRLPFDSIDDYEFLEAVEVDYDYEAIMEELGHDSTAYGGYDSLYEAFIAKLRDL